MLAIRPDFLSNLASLKSAIADVEGYLAPRDIAMLAMAAMHPTASGDVLEIGAFRGKSTVLLAKAAALAGDWTIHSCDPLTWSEAAIPPTPAEARADFDANLRRCGVLEQVKFYQTTSTELGREWNRPLRMLWVDGDHSYDGVKSDLQLFLPHLEDGGILLMHDVLSACSGPSRGFLEDVLASPHFGPCGIHGNVAWAQYWCDPRVAKPHAAAKRKLAKTLAPIVPYQTSEQGERVMSLTQKWKFKLLRCHILMTSPPPYGWLPAAKPRALQPA